MSGQLSGPGGGGSASRSLGGHQGKGKELELLTFLYLISGYLCDY